MYNKIKGLLQGGIGFYTAVFISVYLTAWVLNAVQNMHFDLDRLREIYAWLMTQLNANHAVNSIFNSPKGVMPGKEEIDRENCN